MKNPIFRVIKKLAEDDVEDYCANHAGRFSGLVPRISTIDCYIIILLEWSRPLFLPKLTYHSQ